MEKERRSMSDWDEEGLEAGKKRLATEAAELLEQARQEMATLNVAMHRSRDAYSRLRRQLREAEAKYHTLLAKTQGEEKADG